MPEKRKRKRPHTPEQKATWFMIRVAEGMAAWTSFAQASFMAPVYSVAFAQSKDSAERRLAQGHGRLIRSPNHRGDIWILDPRFPISEAVIRRRFGSTQGPAAKHASLARALPSRFRIGPGNPFDKATIFTPTKIDETPAAAIS